MRCKVIAARFLLDANLSPKAGRFLTQQLQLDVLSLHGQRLRQLPDHEVIRLARSMERVIVTMDRDFAEYFHRTQRPIIGIIYLDLPNPTATTNSTRFDAAHRGFVARLVQNGPGGRPCLVELDTDPAPHRRRSRRTALRARGLHRGDPPSDSHGANPIAAVDRCRSLPARTSLAHRSVNVWDGCRSPARQTV